MVERTSMNNSILEELVNIGDLKSYNYQIIEDNFGSDFSSDFREAERVTLVFPSGTKLVLETFCSGSSQNTYFMISK